MKTTDRFVISSRPSWVPRNSCSITLKSSPFLIRPREFWFRDCHDVESNHPLSVLVHFPCMASIASAIFCPIFSSSHNNDIPAYAVMFNTCSDNQSFTFCGKWVGLFWSYMMVPSMSLTQNASFSFPLEMCGPWNCGTLSSKFSHFEGIPVSILFLVDS